MFEYENGRKSGNRYWTVKVSKWLAEGREIRISADAVEIDGVGNLIFRNEWVEGEPLMMDTVFASGQWVAFFMANVMDSSPSSIDYWPEEVSHS